MELYTPDGRACFLYAEAASGACRFWVAMHQDTQGQLAEHLVAAFVHGLRHGLLGRLTELANPEQYQTQTISALQGSGGTSCLLHYGGPSGVPVPKKLWALPLVADLWVTQAPINTGLDQPRNQSSPWRHNGDAAGLQLWVLSRRGTGVPLVRVIEELRRLCGNRVTPPAEENFVAMMWDQARQQWVEVDPKRGAEDWTVPYTHTKPHSNERGQPSPKAQRTKPPVRSDSPTKPQRTSASGLMQKVLTPSLWRTSPKPKR